MRRSTFSRYSFEEEAFILSHLCIWRRATIARHLGKSVPAIRSWCWRHGQNPRNRMLTSGQAAKLCGVCCQWLTQLARQKRIKARREPGGRWWLFAPEALRGIVVDRDREKLRRAGRIGARLRWRCDA